MDVDMLELGKASEAPHATQRRAGAQGTATSVSVAIAGSGGSGVMTAGTLLLDAAAKAGYYGLMVRTSGPQIRGGEAAALVRLSPRPVDSLGDAFDLLLALVRRRGAVASRLELLKEVWGHQAEVMTRTVDIHIAELRRKLEDDASTPKHILTVWKAGYRLQV